MSRTLLHIATDWPGKFPNIAGTIATLVSAGGDVHARIEGVSRAETSLHWAAGSDDVAGIDALIAAGAVVDLDGAVPAGGTPLADATAFGQWRARQRLLEHGAQPNLWQAAALGLLDRVQTLRAQDDPTADDITSAFWGCLPGRPSGGREGVARSRC